MPAVVSDSSPLIYLSRLERFELLKALYGQILIPSAVWEEVAVQGGARVEAANVKAAAAAGWLRVENPRGRLSLPSGQLEALEEGERAAIQLARELRAILVIDDGFGRLIAEGFGIEITGTAGMLIRAKRFGCIPAFRPLLDELREKTNFRMSYELYVSSLQLAGESLN